MEYTTCQLFHSQLVNSWITKVKQVKQYFGAAPSRLTRSVFIPFQAGALTRPLGTESYGNYLRHRSPGCYSIRWANAWCVSPRQAPGQEPVIQITLIRFGMACPIEPLGKWSCSNLKRCTIISSVTYLNTPSTITHLRISPMYTYLLDNWTHKQFLMEIWQKAQSTIFSEQALGKNVH